MRRRLAVKLALALAAVAVATAALTLPAAIVYTERRIGSLSAEERRRVERAIEVDSWDDFDGLGEWAAVAAVAATLGTVLGLGLARRLTRPVERVAAAASRVAAGDFSARTGIARADEIGRLARDFDTMAEDLERLERDRQVAAATIAHELRTPVTVLRARLQAARDGLLEIDGAELAQLLAQLDGLVVLVEDLRTLSLATAGRLRLSPADIDLGAELAGEVAALAPLAEARGVTLVAPAPGPVPARADPVRVRQIARNLVENAIRHTPPGGSVRVRAATAEGHPVVEVADEGPGLPDAVAHGALAPFTTGEGGRDRSGLGLSIVRSLAEAHGGRVELSSSPAGTTIRVHLPIAAPGDAAAP